MGFDVAEGPEIESDWFNFTALNTPKTIPRVPCTTPFMSKAAREGAQPAAHPHQPDADRHAVQHVKKYRARGDNARARPCPRFA
jgi:phenylalanyl-tRNA synthetase alpha chain